MRYCTNPFTATGTLHRFPLVGLLSQEPYQCRSVSWVSGGDAFQGEVGTSEEELGQQLWIHNMPHCTHSTHTRLPYGDCFWKDFDECPLRSPKDAGKDNIKFCLTWQVQAPSIWQVPSSFLLTRLEILRPCSDSNQSAKQCS